MRGPSSIEHSSKAVAIHPISASDPNNNLAPADQATRNGKLLPLLPLNEHEQIDLAGCEQLLEDRTRPLFYEWGRALSSIQQNKLYRASHKTFEEYCGQRWKIHRSYAFRLIKASEIVESLMPNGDLPLPTAEAQVRALTKVNRKLIKAIWRQAVNDAGGKALKTRHVLRAIAKLTTTTSRKNVTGRQFGATAQAYQSGSQPSQALCERLSLLTQKDVQLTGREQEVLCFLSGGLSDKEIAARLDLATVTVQTHVQHIREKLHVHNRVQLALLYHGYKTP